MNIKSGRDNLACTIFVPFDCNNNCPFCTSKKMYSEMSDNFNMEKILQIIDRINYQPFVNEFVLTGGEPTANLEMLKEIVSHCKKTVYINTTLPLVKNIDEVIDFINNNEMIRGISVSRHIGFNFNNVATLSLLDRITKHIRINTVINKNFTFDKFNTFVNEYGKHGRDINLRADYRNLDIFTLKARNEITNYMLANYEYLGTNSCMVCNTEHFSNGTCIIMYHRGLMYSSFICGEKMFVNDVIVTPDGNIHHDWNFSEEESKEFIDWCLSYELPSNIKIIDEDNVEEIEQLILKYKTK